MFEKPIFSYGCCIFAHLAVVTQQQVHMQQCKNFGRKTSEETWGRYLQKWEDNIKRDLGSNYCRDFANMVPVPCKRTFLIKWTLTSFPRTLSIMELVNTIKLRHEWPLGLRRTGCWISWKLGQKQVSSQTLITQKLYFLGHLTFRRIVAPPSSGSKNKPSKRPAK
jgi:hypothetical protein